MINWPLETCWSPERPFQVDFQPLYSHLWEHVTKPGLQCTIISVVSNSCLLFDLNPYPSGLPSVQTEATEVKREWLLSRAPDVGLSATWVWPRNVIVNIFIFLCLNYSQIFLHLFQESFLFWAKNGSQRNFPISKYAPCMLSFQAWARVAWQLNCASYFCFTSLIVLAFPVRYISCSSTEHMYADCCSISPQGIR